MNDSIWDGTVTAVEPWTQADDVFARDRCHAKVESKTAQQPYPPNLQDSCFSDRQVRISTIEPIIMSKNITVKLLY